MKRPVRIQISGENGFEPPREVLLVADSRARVADVVRALGGGREDVLIVSQTPISPESLSKEAFAVEPNLALPRAPIPPGAVLAPLSRDWFKSGGSKTAASQDANQTYGQAASGGRNKGEVGKQNHLPSPPRGLKSLVPYTPKPLSDPVFGPLEIPEPPRPSVWALTPVTLAIPIVPALLFLILAIAAPSIGTAFLALLGIGAGVGEVALAGLSNQKAWREYETRLAAYPASYQSALAERDRLVRASVPNLEDPREAAKAGLWGFPLEEFRVPLGFTRVPPEVNSEITTVSGSMFRGLGLMRTAWGLNRWQSTPYTVAEQSVGKPGLFEPVKRYDLQVYELLEKHHPGKVTSLETLYASPEPGALAIVGNEKLRTAAGANLLMRAALRYNPGEFALAVLTQNPESWTWAAYLPQAATTRDRLGIEPVQVLSENNAELFSAALAASLQRCKKRYRMLIVVDGAIPSGSALEDLAENPTIWLVNLVAERSLAVVEVGQVLDLASGQFYFPKSTTASSPLLHPQAQSSSPMRLSLEPLLLSGVSAKRLAVALAGLKLPGKTPGEIPEAARLNEAYPELDTTTGESDCPEKAKDESGVASLSAPVGFGLEGIVTLDLTKGQNAMILGGTTLERTNFIASYLSGLALKQKPQDVNFLIFDSRGANWGELASTPHCLGVETGRGEEVFSRLMRYLEAETARREQWIETSGFASIAAAREKGKPAPAELIVAVATAQSFSPRNLSDLANRMHLYRSLGLHLIVAGGDPQHVPENSWRFFPVRILASLDAPDLERASGNLDLGDPKQIYRVAGRMVLISQGVARPMQAMSALTPENYADAASAPARFTPLGALELPKSLTSGTILGAASTGISLATPLSLVAKHFQRGARSGKAWISSLGTIYDLSKLPGGESKTGGVETGGVGISGAGISTGTGAGDTLLLGVQDDLARQRLASFGFSPSTHGALAIFGSEGSGKTTALRTLATSSLRGEPTWIYVLTAADCADEPGELGVLRAWPSVGVVARAGDGETVADLVEMLSELVRQRRETGGEAPADFPTRVLVLIDGLEQALGNLPATASGQLLEILSGGRRAKVHLAVSAQSPEALPKSWRSAFGLRIQLAGRPAGRARIEGDSRALQFAILGNDPDPMMQNRIVSRLAKVPMPPAPVFTPAVASPLTEALAQAPKGEMALGVEACSGKQLNTITSGIYLITGPKGCGKTSALEFLAASLRRASEDTGLVLVSLKETPLSHQTLWDAVAAGPGEFEDFSHQLLAVASEKAPPGFPGLAIFVEDLPDFAKNPQIAEMMRKVVEAARRNGHFLAATGSPEAWEGSSALVGAVKSPAAGLALGLSAEAVSRIFGVRVSQDGSVFPPGRGYWIHRGIATKIQIPWENI